MRALQAAFPTGFRPRSSRASTLQNGCKVLCTLALFLILVVGCGPSVVEVQPDLAQGGRAVAIAIEPGANPYAFVASETGGLFATVDGGLTFRHVDSFPSSRINDIAYSPSNGNIVLATAADDFLEGGNGGIWRSTDGGRTWTQPVGSRPAASDRCTNHVSAYGISFSRSSGSVVVGTDCGIAISTNEGAIWSHVVINPHRNVTPDRRQNRVWSVSAAPGSRIYAVGNDGVAISADGGGNWTVVTGDPFRPQEGVVHAIAHSPLNVDDVFVVARLPASDGGGSSPNVLFFSHDGGTTWAWIKQGENNRPAFVRTARSAAGNPSAFDVYFGDGKHMWRRSYNNTTPPTILVDWQQLNLDHPDPSDVATGLDGSTPLLLTTDGGVHRTTNSGVNWLLTGGGRNGYAALQITEVTGELVSSQFHTDNYFATQDNFIWASSDGASTWTVNICCEGFSLRTPRRATAHSTGVVTGSKCLPCVSFLADSHLSNLRNWPNAPDGDADPNDNQGVPFLLKTKTYVQHVVNDDTAPPTHKLMLTQDTGSSWSDRGAIPANLIGPPLMGDSEGASPVMYSAIKRDGVNADGSQKLGLVRIKNLYGPGDVQVEDADAGLGSLGTFPTMFAWYRVFGVDPSNANRLIVPDIVTEEMKVSEDGGNTWRGDPALTSLLTKNGTYRFTLEGGYTLVSTISWNPENTCDILVGTRQNGIFRSTDGGSTWHAIAGSEVIPNISRFFTESPTSVLVSSYGRGLWRLHLSSASRGCERPPKLFPVLPPALQVWETTGKRRAFKSLSDPQICTVCTAIIVNWGEITHLDLSGTTVHLIGVSGGFVRHVDSIGKPRKLLPVEARNETRPAKNDSVFNEIRRSRLPIKGLILEGSELRGYIVGNAEVDHDRLEAPRIRLYAADMSTGDARVEPGEQLSVRGSGFSTLPGATISFLLDERLVTRDLKVGTGSFQYDFKVNEVAGDHVIEVIQSDPYTFRIARERFLVKTSDASP